MEILTRTTTSLTENYVTREIIYSRKLRRLAIWCRN